MFSGLPAILEVFRFSTLEYDAQTCLPNRKKQFYHPVTSRPPILTAFILYFYLPLTWRSMKWKTPLQRPKTSLEEKGLEVNCALQGKVILCIKS